ncbi:hypothetical protein [Klebsiella pneumoniae]
MYFDAAAACCRTSKIMSLFSRQRVISYIIAVIVYCGF